DIGEGATDVRFTPKSGHSVEQLAGLRIEISVADAAVDGAMAKADIREIAGTVQADRNVAGQINHVIVGAGGCAGIDWSRSWSGLYLPLPVATTISPRSRAMPYSCASSIRCLEFC